MFNNIYSTLLVTVDSMHCLNTELYIVYTRFNLKKEYSGNNLCSMGYFNSKNATPNSRGGFFFGGGGGMVKQGGKNIPAPLFRREQRVLNGESA